MTHARENKIFRRGAYECAMERVNVIVLDRERYGDGDSDGSALILFVRLPGKPGTRESGTVTFSAYTWYRFSR